VEGALITDGSSSSFCDYDLPQYNGALALVAAKKLRPEVPFILVTGAIDEDDGPCGEILVQGARECILKDHLERLAPAVRKALGGERRPG